MSGELLLIATDIDVERYDTHCCGPETYLPL